MALAGPDPPRRRRENMRVNLTAALTAVCAVSLLGCGKKQEIEQPVPVQSDVPTSSPITEPVVPTAMTDEKTDDRTQRLSILEQRIQFDYDRADLSMAAKQVLEAKASVLEADRSINVRIEGHADERGSDEYNLALGNRRAMAAKRFLVQRGIASERLETVSYGEERPLSSGHDEGAWAENRRDEFHLTNRGSLSSR